jgi:RNA polymerase II subunit A C-terminal domain phosphatase
MSSSTNLYLPTSFPYPIKIVSLDASSVSSIQRGTRLLTYSFEYTPRPPDAKPETRFGTWDSVFEGVINSWQIKRGDVISERRAREKPALLITEPCKHGVQIGGLCGLCGKDMTEYVVPQPHLLKGLWRNSYDYTGFSNTSRASIQMTHSAFGPTVSLEEAQRLEQETADHLLKSRKLSLIVDLDQTIVHATVDPTVGDWISEGEAWEAKQAKKALVTTTTNKDEEDSDADSDSDETETESEDECNPNWEALKDVKKFRLGPESFGTPFREHWSMKGKHIENEGCIYYIKPR